MNKFDSEDQAFYDSAKAFVEKIKNERKHFFGYPGNLSQDSEMVKKLRLLETELYYMNNAGDPFERGDNSFDGKAYEQELLQLFFERYHMDPQTSWGYISSGGSESNWWAIKQGFTKYQNGHLLFSKAAHYSVLKAISLGERALVEYSVIDTVDGPSESISIDNLMSKIDELVGRNQVPILLLTWGTTRLGSLDNIQEITRRLKLRQIDYYCHVDAAFYGGLALNQKDAPVIKSLDELGADSISISFHKLFGIADINSVVLSKVKSSGSYIDYIGHHDTTISGSRTFSIFSATQKIKEVLKRSEDDLFIKNVIYFESLLIAGNIPYFRDSQSNIFVISKPSETFRKKYHLSSFNGKNHKETCTHIIMNSFHTIEEIDELYNDLILENLTQVDL